ncbi:MAG: ATP12 family protein [Pseudomonadota bacterium]
MAGTAAMTENPEKPKKFYKTVSIENSEREFEIHLDGRPLKNGAGESLSIRTKPLAQAIAQEWRQQDEEIDRAAMPITAMTTAAAHTEKADQWRQDVIDYLRSDLLCYRAEKPRELASRQSDRWDPYLEWVNSIAGAPLAVTAGVMAIEQSEDVINNIAQLLTPATPEELLALRTLTALTGSAVLALALWKGDHDPESVFYASRVDETFQAEQWGRDSEALAREKAMQTEFLQCAMFLKLVSSK